ncbi:MAG TPA: glycosyltransferase family 2 protein, partial [Flavobacterium sp.]|nr:glycosyltransferase family 2 protein [Flavobacterium sp.]
PFCRGRIFEHLEKDHGQYDDNTYIFWASGACLFIRRSVFNELKGFDADFFAHQEEIDLCWRAFNLGYKTQYIAASMVFHVGGATLDSGNPQKTFLNFRNSLLMLLKNLPQKHLYKILLFRMILDGIAGFRFLLQGNPRHFNAVVKAHVAFYKVFQKNKAKRFLTADIDYYKIDSIVIAAFVRKRTTFKSLF